MHILPPVPGALARGARIALIVGLVGTSLVAPLNVSAAQVHRGIFGAHRMSAQRRFAQVVRTPLLSGSIEQLSAPGLQVFVSARKLLPKHARLVAQLTLGSTRHPASGT